MKIRRNQIIGFLSFLFHHYDRHFAQVFDGSNKSGDPKGFTFAIQGEEDFLITEYQNHEEAKAGFKWSQILMEIKDILTMAHECIDRHPPGDTAKGIT